MIASVQLLSVVEQLMSGKEVEIEGRSFKVTRTKLGGMGGELCRAARDWTAEGGCPYVGCGCRGQGWQATRGKGGCPYVGCGCRGQGCPRHLG